MGMRAARRMWQGPEAEGVGHKSHCTGCSVNSSCGKPSMCAKEVEFKSHQSSGAGGARTSPSQSETVKRWAGAGFDRTP